MRAETLWQSLPPEWPEDLLPEIRAANALNGRALVVLDDDPTGTQTVHALPVLTRWTAAALAAELSRGRPAFYLLTNTRALPLREAQALNQSIGQHLLAAVRAVGRSVAVVSRSDSTLRGHFPGEVQALDAALGGGFDAWVLVPCFPEGGRCTIGDVHYAAEGERLTPAGETEFARDKTFGYRASNLKEWVAEKTRGAIAADEVISIALHTLRQGGPRAVRDQLLALPAARSGGGPPRVIVANAASYRDLEVLALGLRWAEQAGRRYLYRTAASFVRVMAGLAARPLLSPAELLASRPIASAAEAHQPESAAGLIVAGSYVPRTTAQLEALFAQTPAARVEIRVESLLDEARRASEIDRAAAAMNRHLTAGRDTVVYTSRALAASQTGGEADLLIGRSISDALVAVVRALRARPRYLLAKGGITSSDIATAGLGIERAMVLGQALPGVPVWQTGPESRFPGLAYIVFPGNVGGPDALAQLVQSLAAARGSLWGDNTS